MSNNFNALILASEARIATTNGADQTNSRHKGCHVIIDVTAKGGTISLVPTIQGKDPVSGKYYTILTGTAITIVSTTVLKVYPGLTASANAIANDIIPSKYRVIMTHGNATSATYSVSISLV